MHEIAQTIQAHGIDIQRQHRWQAGPCQPDELVAVVEHFVNPAATAIDDGEPVLVPARNPAKRCAGRQLAEIQVIDISFPEPRIQT